MQGCSGSWEGTGRQKEPPWAPRPESDRKSLRSVDEGVTGGPKTAVTVQGTKQRRGPEKAGQIGAMHTHSTAALGSLLGGKGGRQGAVRVRLRSTDFRGRREA